MADGIVLNAGSGGSTLATHEASAISAAGLQQYELVQLVTGTGLTKSFVGSANAFPVFLAAQASATQNVHVASISPTVNVHIASQSATLQVRIAQATSAGVNIGTVNNISATVNVAGNLTTSENLSSTFTTTTASATGLDTIIAAPGAASAIRVFTILATNKSTTLTRVKFAESASNAVRVMGDCALGGGGFFWAPKRSWILPLNTALTGIVSPAASDVAITVEYVIE